jgi:hypothetical protein
LRLRQRGAKQWRGGAGRGDARHQLATRQAFLLDFVGHGLPHGFARSLSKPSAKKSAPEN